MRALLCSVLLLAACRPAPAPPPAPDAGPARPPLTLHFTVLAAALRDATGDWRATPPAGSSSQAGESAISEASREYARGAQKGLIRVVDSTAMRGAPAATGKPFDDGTRLGRDVQLDGARGFVVVDRAQHRGHAELLVAGRLRIAVTVNGTEAAEDVEQLARAVDVPRLAQAVAGQPSR